jgi:hypothetical protein
VTGGIENVPASRSTVMQLLSFPERRAYSCDMSGNPLEDVLTVEREIAELLGNERTKAAQWLEEQKRDIDAAAQTELAHIEQNAHGGEETARRAAAANAAAIVERARAFAARIDALEDARLAPLVLEHLSFILPGAPT